MDDLLSEDIGRLIGKHGREKVGKFMQKIAFNNKEIQPAGAGGNKRAMYNFLKASYPPDVIISESYLRADVLLGTANTYTFPVLSQDAKNVANLPSTTKSLDQNDTFEVVDFCLMIWTIANTGTIPNAATRRLYTYPNATVFAGAGEADALDGLYFGSELEYKLGTTTIYPALDCLRFYRVPTSQQGVTTAAIAGPVQYTIPRDGWPNSMYPWQAPLPALTVSGNSKAKFSLSYEGTSITMSPLAAQNRNNYVTLYLRGFLCSNGAKQDNKKFSPIRSY